MQSSLEPKYFHKKRLCFYIQSGNITTRTYGPLGRRQRTKKGEAVHSL